MSHLKCPVCSKYTPLSSFDPEDHERDLSVVRFRGLGRGRGFEVAESSSVLGDEEITPKVMDRMTSFLRMMREEGIINDESLITSLGLEDTRTARSEPYLENPLEQKIHQLSLLLQLKDGEIRKLKNEESYLQSRLWTASIESEEKEKQLKLEKLKSGVILLLKDLCEYSIEFTGDSEWTLVINEIKEDRCTDFIHILMEQDISFIRSLWKKIKPGNYYVEIQLKAIKDLIEQENKPVSERLLELDFEHLLSSRDRKFNFEPV